MPQIGENCGLSNPVDVVQLQIPVLETILDGLLLLDEGRSP